MRYIMLRDYVRLNQSMLVAIAVAFPASALAADMLSDQESYLNATYATIVDYAAYLGTFGVMFYITNRHRYRAGPDGRRGANPRSDFKKIVASAGIGEIVYGAVRWPMQYYLLDAWHYEAYLASVAAQAVAVIIYMIAMNLSVRATGMYKGGADGAPRK